MHGKDCTWIGINRWMFLSSSESIIIRGIRRTRTTLWDTPRVRHDPNVSLRKDGRPTGCAGVVGLWHVRKLFLPIWPQFMHFTTPEKSSVTSACSTSDGSLFLDFANDDLKHQQAYQNPLSTSSSARHWKAPGHIRTFISPRLCPLRWCTLPTPSTMYLTSLDRLGRLHRSPVVVTFIDI